MIALLAQNAYLTPIAEAQSSIAVLDELSGIVASRRRPGVYYAHNDSGDSARFFALRLDGSNAGPATGIEVPGAANVDWEDIATDGKTLYLSDLGNNANRRRDLTIYAVHDLAADSIAPRAKWTVAYPDQTEFPPAGDKRWDCEALIVWRGKLHALTKWRTSGGLPVDGTSLYRLDSPREGVTNPLVKVGTKTGLGGWVTAADVSPDNARVAVLTHFPQPGIWTFDARRAGTNFLSRPLKRYLLDPAMGQIEAIAWTAKNEVVVTNEPGRMWRFRI